MVRAGALCGAILFVGIAAGCTVVEEKTEPTPSVAATLDPRTVFGSTVDFVWQEHPGPGAGPFMNEDATLPVGFYRLDVACDGGALTVVADGAAQTTVPCGGAVTTIPVCLAEAGLRATAIWGTGASGDLVWQLRRHKGSAGK